MRCSCLHNPHLIPWNFFFPSVMKGGSIPSCCTHHVLSFRRHPWPPAAPFQHLFVMAPAWPGSLAILFSHATCRFSWVTVAFSSCVVCAPPMLRQTCVQKSACLWLAPMQSSSSSFKACITRRLWVTNSCGLLRLHKAMYKAQISALLLVLRTSTTRAT